MPKVSVVLPVYNGEKFVSEAIESVVAQTYPSWELITVDDGSTDKTPDILEKYKEKLHEKMRLITQKNSGVSVARNKGIDASKGRYIAFLDHDDVWMPEKLEKQVKALDSNKAWGMVYCDSYIIDEEGSVREDSYIRSVLSKNILKSKKFNGKIFEELFLVNYISLETAVIRRKVLNEVGGFDPKYKINQDYDLFLRIARHYPIGFIENPLSNYRVHQGGISRNVERRVAESIQIIDQWLKKEPSLKRKLGYKIKLRKASERGSLIKHYLKKGNFKKFAREIVKFLHDMV